MLKNGSVQRFDAIAQMRLEMSLKKSLEECVYDDYPTALPMHKGIETDLEIYGFNSIMPTKA